MSIKPVSVDTFSSVSSRETLVISLVATLALGLISTGLIPLLAARGVHVGMFHSIAITPSVGWGLIAGGGVLFAGTIAYIIRRVLTHRELNKWDHVFDHLNSVHYREGGKNEPLGNCCYIADENDSTAMLIFISQGNNRSIEVYRGSTAEEAGEQTMARIDELDREEIRFMGSPLFRRKIDMSTVIMTWSSVANESDNAIFAKYQDQIYDVFVSFQTNIQDGVQQSVLRTDEGYIFTMTAEGKKRSLHIQTPAK